jgi:hypothetical protein
MRMKAKSETQQPGIKAETTNTMVRHAKPAVAGDAATWPSAPWPFRAEDIGPLAWWRTMPADHLRDAEHLVLRDILSKVSLLRGCEWVSAMRGDAAASVAIAIGVQPIKEVSIEVDVAMSALLLNALAGDAGAALVLSEVLRQTQLDHPFAKELAASWLVLNLSRALNAVPRATKAKVRTKVSNMRGAISNDLKASA